MDLAAYIESAELTGLLNGVRGISYELETKGYQRRWVEQSSVAKHIFSSDREKGVGEHMREYSWMVAALCVMGLLVASLAEVAQAKPRYGVSCGVSGCHGSARDGMVIVDYDALTNLGDEDLKTFTVEAGKSVSLSINVIDGHDKYAAVLKDLEKAGVLKGNSNGLVFTPDSEWVDYSAMSPPYYASTSSKHEWAGGARQFTFDLQVDGSTPTDFYALRFELAGKGGGKWSQEEEFYLHVLPAEPIPGNGDINGDGDVNMCDFSLFASNWPNAGCSLENDFCGGSDIDVDGDVDFNDLSVLAANWLVLCPRNKVC
jgi:hypothetical protein